MPQVMRGVVVVSKPGSQEGCCRAHIPRLTPTLPPWEGGYRSGRVAHSLGLWGRARGHDDYVPTRLSCDHQKHRASCSFPYQKLEDDSHSDTDDLNGNHNNRIQQFDFLGPDG